MIKKCKMCKITFSTSRKDKIFCSKKCSSYYNFLEYKKKHYDKLIKQQKLNREMKDKTIDEIENLIMKYRDVVIQLQLIKKNLQKHYGFGKKLTSPAPKLKYQKV